MNFKKGITFFTSVFFANLSRGALWHVAISVANCQINIR